MSARLQTVWPALALAASLAMLGAAHAFETFGNLYPCHLCLKQREVYWGAATVAVIALVLMRLRPRPHLARLANTALGLVFLIGFGVAAYHVAAEQHWVFPRCDQTDFGAIGTLQPGGSYRNVQCDRIAWSMFGISMAGYNAMISFALAAISFVAASRRSQHA